MNIGKSFGQELITAGLGHLPISWNPEGEFFGREELSAEQNIALDKIILAHKADTWQKQQEAKHEHRVMFYNEIREFTNWLQKATSADIDKWVEENDPKLILKLLVKTLAAR